jgi:hypothetical protein
MITIATKTVMPLDFNGRINFCLFSIANETVQLKQTNRFVECAVGNPLYKKRASQGCSF